MKSLFTQKLADEAEQYKNKILDDVLSGNQSCAYSALRKLGSRPGDVVTSTFTLPAHLDYNYSAQQLAEVIADHFSAISQDYNPINLFNFQPR